MKRVLSVAAAAALMSLAVPAPARSQLVHVSPDCDYVIWWGVSVMDVFSPDATDCAGAFHGNDVNQQPGVLGEILAQGWGSGSYLGSTDTESNSGPFRRVPDDTYGRLIFDSPLTGNYVIALKASNQFSLYYFAGLDRQSEIFYSTLGTAQNRHGNAQALSHASLYRIASSPPNPPVSVPEPASAMLLLTGLAGLGVAHRRKREES